MKGNNSNSTANQAVPPKRSFFSYICPCFNFNSNHTLKEADKNSMNHTEDSTSSLPFDHTKPKESVTEANPEPTHMHLDQSHKNAQQSGIYITFKQN
jgi:hypothetical protein